MGRGEEEPRWIEMSDISNSNEGEISPLMKFIMT